MPFKKKRWYLFYVRKRLENYLTWLITWSDERLKHFYVLTQIQSTPFWFFDGKVDALLTRKQMLQRRGLVFEDVLTGSTRGIRCYCLWKWWFRDKYKDLNTDFLHPEPCRRKINHPASSQIFALCWNRNRNNKPTQRVSSKERLRYVSTVTRI